MFVSNTDPSGPLKYAIVLVGNLKVKRGMDASLLSKFTIQILVPFITPDSVFDLGPHGIDLSGSVRHSSSQSTMKIFSCVPFSEPERVPESSAYQSSVKGSTRVVMSNDRASAASIVNEPMIFFWSSAVALSVLNINFK
jgi:hypothetical protein